MKRISAYQATDGSLHADKQACKLHQKAIDVVEGVGLIAQRLIEPITNPNQLVDFISQHSFDLLEALQGREIQELREKRKSSEAAHTNDELDDEQLEAIAALE